MAGSASISQSASQTTINQASSRAALSWQTYNVGSQQRVLYNQPSSSSVALNRVNDPSPSQIAGRIDANGHIVLMNQAGVVFYQGAQVNTGGLMVTAASMSDGAMKSFVGGAPMSFDQMPKPNARVENRGSITVADTGLAALVAPQVANSGTITARLGKVVLAGANKAAIDLYGDGLVSIDVTGQVVQAPIGPDGKPVTALVTNTGVIRADGGTVQLTARAADGIVTTLVDAGGKIRANTVDGKAGVVALNGVGGGIVVEGQLSAAGRAPDSMGGSVEVNATGPVTVASTARINASGQAGGGTVALGTTLARAKGGPSVTPTLTASGVTVQKGAVIRADAKTKGNGGKVTVLSTGTTVMNGTISATGGLNGGDGGFIETSGKAILDIGPTASVTAAAPYGHGGIWLLDPDSNIDITNATANVTCAAGVCSPTADSSTLDAATIVTSLNGGTSVTVTTSNPTGTEAGNITVDSGIALTAAKTVSLTLDAGAGGGAGSVTINQQITDSGSGGALSLVLNAGGGIAFNKTVTLGGSLTATAGMHGAGDITQASAGNLVVAGAASFTNQSSNGHITLNTSSTVNQLTGSVSFVTTGTSGNVAVSNDSGASGTVLGTSTVNGSLSITDTSGSISQTGVLKATGAASFSTTTSNKRELSG